MYPGPIQANVRGGNLYPASIQAKLREVNCVPLPFKLMLAPCIDITSQLKLESLDMGVVFLKSLRKRY